MRTFPFPKNLFHQVFPCHKVILSTKPHRTSCHIWKEVSDITLAEVTEINPDAIVECYLDVKYYHYDPDELNDLSNVYDNFKALTDSDEVLTVSKATMDNIKACTSIDDNFKELDNACPSWKRTLRLSIPSGWNIISLDTWPKIRRVLCALKNQEKNFCPILKRNMKILREAKKEKTHTHTQLKCTFLGHVFVVKLVPNMTKRLAAARSKAIFIYWFFHMQIYIYVLWGQVLTKFGGRLKVRLWPTYWGVFSFCKDHGGLMEGFFFDRKKWLYNG